MCDELSRCVAWYAATRARVESGIVPVQLLEAFAGGLHPLRRSWHDWTGGAHLFWIGYERTPGGPVRYSACPQRAGPLFNFTTGLYPRRAHHNGPERKLGLEREREREREIGAAFGLAKGNPRPDRGTRKPQGEVGRGEGACPRRGHRRGRAPGSGAQGRTTADQRADKRPPCFPGIAAASR
jgi:hypothetical protein